MRKKTQWLLATCLCTGLGSAAHGALQVALHEVNTSVGLQPTTTANKWKLQTDPDVPNPDPNLSDYIPIAGELSNTYDASQFSLAQNSSPPPAQLAAGSTNVGTPQYAINTTVQGINTYNVMSFDVMYNNGGYYQVTGQGETAINNPSGGEKGEVDNILFEYNPNDTTDPAPLPINQDQLFFQLNLVANEDTPTIIDQNYSAFGGPNGFLQGQDIYDSSQMPTLSVANGDTFDTSYVPEPAGALGIAVIGLLVMARRR